MAWPSDGSVEQLNCDVKDMLTAWLWDSNSTYWPLVLCFVQVQKNSSYHSGIKQSPYKAFLGTEVKVGLRSKFLKEWSLKMTVLQHMPPCQKIRRQQSRTLPPQQKGKRQQRLKQPPAITPGESRHRRRSSAQLTTIQQNIQIQRKRATDGQLAQAECTVKRSHLELVPGNPGDNVTITIPFGDHGKGDPRNIMGVIVDRY